MHAFNTRLAALALLALSPALMAADICRSTARMQLQAAGLEAREDLIVTLAACANMEDRDERLECQAEARAEYGETRALAVQQFLARISLCDKLGGGLYDPEIDPADFSNVVDNTWFPFPVGASWLYEAETDEGLEVIEITVLEETRVILGVECVTVRDTVTLDGEFVEDTYDWYAQDDDGNVWYFGEISFNNTDGWVEDIHGSWLGGEAEPGEPISLDIMLPGLDGLSVLRALRNEGVETHVLLLTAKDTVPDRVEGLRAGADDYLVKPFAFDELAARVDALVRRVRGPSTPQQSLAGLSIDTGARVVCRGERRLDLSRREQALLCYLMSRVGETVSRIEIEDQLYDEDTLPISNVAVSATLTDEYDAGLLARARARCWPLRFGCAYPPASTKARCCSARSTTARTWIRPLKATASCPTSRAPGSCAGWRRAWAPCARPSAAAAPCSWPHRWTACPWAAPRPRTEPQLALSCSACTG